MALLQFNFTFLHILDIYDCHMFNSSLSILEKGSSALDSLRVDESAGAESKIFLVFCFLEILVEVLFSLMYVQRCSSKTRVKETVLRSIGER